MSKKYQPLLITHYMSTWVTITEAVEITTKAIKQKITPSDNLSSCLEWQHPTIGLFPVSCDT